ncbi:MAG: DUF3887 domain-containing protein [Armatimonadetes bacterium]|nr:DUF3887 domain-containing protein [Armatimonadota bacterium]
MKQNIRKFGVESLCVLLVVQLSGCNSATGIKPSQATTSQFLQEMQGQQFSGAYSLLSSKFKSTITQQQLKDHWESVEKSKGKLQSWSQQGFQTYSGTGGSSVKLSYALQCAKGAAGITFSCVEENNKWLIQGFNINF